MTITEQDLARLLEAKDAAREAWKKAFDRAWELKDQPTDIRLPAEVAKGKALTAHTKADLAYDAALRAFVEQEAEAA